NFPLLDNPGRARPKNIKRFYIQRRRTQYLNTSLTTRNRSLEFHLKSQQGGNIYIFIRQRFYRQTTYLSQEKRHPTLWSSDIPQPRETVKNPSKQRNSKSNFLPRPPLQINKLLFISINNKIERRSIKKVSRKEPIRSSRTEILYKS